MNTNEIFQKVDQLIAGWCDRRALKPLRYILKSYPLVGGLTDEWAALLESLKDIKGLCANELTNTEKQLLVETINAVHDVVYRQT